MSWASTRSIATIGVLAASVPLLLLVGRVLYAFFVPTPAAALVWDVLVMSVATMGTLVFLGIHLQSAVAQPLADVQTTLDGMLAGRLDGPRTSAGPAEVRALAHSVHTLAQGLERRLDSVTRESGVAAASSVLPGVAHEVSNALASMRLSVYLLVERARRAGDDDGSRILARVTRGLDRLEEIVVTLRAAGGPAGRHQPERLVRAALIVAQRSVLGCDVRVANDARQDVECTPEGVVQGLVALLQNAGEAGAKRIWVSTLDEPGRVAFQVEDDGTGVPASIVGQALEPFVTTKAGHAGLGLHHAATTAREHGGGLEIARAATGTTAVLRIRAA